MRYVRLRIYPGMSIHPIYGYVDGADDVRRCSVVQWNARDPTELVLVYRVEGGEQGFEDALERADEVLEHQLTSSHGELYHAVVHTRAPEPMAELWRTATLDGVLLLPPLVQRDDGAIDTRVLAAAEDVSRMMDEMPDWVEYEVDRVSDEGRWSTDLHPGLPERQREALRKAHRLGYYEVPRRATHEEVAEELGCSKSTASEHLRKAEARVLREALGRRRRL